MVSRPPFVPEFWNAMFDVLRQTRTIASHLPIKLSSGQSAESIGQLSG
jgi:hypothetical protein